MRKNNYSNYEEETDFYTHMYVLRTEKYFYFSFYNGPIEAIHTYH